jgi:8-oxo-dGTP pyrophosphatase MutT (NUDIX family)
MPSPFRRLSREILIDNPWHRYCRDRYSLADGSEGDYFYVDMAGACGIIPLFDDGTTALVRVHRYLLDACLWEFPMGGMQPGDDALDVARRELREEAGLLAQEWTELGRFAPYKGVSNETTWFFLARGLTWTEPHLEPTESLSVHVMPLAAARAKILGQRLPDGQTLSGLLLLERHLQRGGA